AAAAATAADAPVAAGTLSWRHAPTLIDDKASASKDALHTAAAATISRVPSGRRESTSGHRDAPSCARPSVRHGVLVASDPNARRACDRSTTNSPAPTRSRDAVPRQRHNAARG